MTIAFIWTVALTLGILGFARNLERAYFGLFAFLSALEVNQITATALMIGALEINVTDIVLATLFLCSIPLMLRSGKVGKPLLLTGILTLTFAVLSFAFNLYLPYDGVSIPATGSWDHLIFGSEHLQQVTIGPRSYLVLIRLVLFVFIAWCTAVVLTGKDFFSIGSYALGFGRVQIAYGLFEFVTKALLGSDIAMKLAAAVFPANDAVVTDIVVRGGIVSLQAFCREPSHFALALTFILLVFVVLRANGYKRRFDLLWVAIGLFLLVMSGAFTAIIGLFIIAIAFFYYLKRGELVIDSRNKALIYLIGFLIVGAGGVFLTNTLMLSNNYYFEKLFGVFANFDSIVNRQYGGALTTFDALPRMASIVECLRNFLDRPVLGIGPGVVNPFSGVVAILSQYGLVFFAMWLAFLYQYSRSVSNDADSGFFLVLVFVSGLLMFSGGYEYSFLWLLLGGLLQSRVAHQRTQSRSRLFGRSR